MKYLLDKNKLYSINETLNVSVSDIVFIHHPITRDIVKVKIKEKSNLYCIVSIPEDSDYFGQPDFKIKKTQIIGKV